MTIEEFLNFVKNDEFSQVGKPCSVEELCELNCVNSWISKSGLIDLLSTHNGVKFGEQLWEIWRSREIFLKSVYPYEFVAFASVMMDSDVYYLSKDGIFSYRENEYKMVAKNLDSFFRFDMLPGWFDTSSSFSGNVSDSWRT